MPWRLLWIGILWQLYNGDFDAAEIRKKEESEGLPVLAMDYFFFSKDEQGLPHLQVRDSQHVLVVGSSGEGS
jgi:hypothetical protein